MRFREFVKANIGKCLDYDKAYAGQCVDLFRFYCKDVLGLPAQPRPVDGAAAFFENYGSDAALRDNFTLIKNAPEAVPRYGDVIVWDRKRGKGYGHVSVFIHGDVNGFTSFDQNWPALSKCTETEHDYVNVIGWLRPKNQKGVTGV
ncbi:MAG: CHAP domain-containing protein [Treponema sp.]|jgi:hypothetical protein|nr:CHAP domain-containing protein [Treponema sp.]